METIKEEYLKRHFSDAKTKVIIRADYLDGRAQLFAKEAAEVVFEACEDYKLFLTSNTKQMIIEFTSQERAIQQSNYRSTAAFARGLNVNEGVSNITVGLSNYILDGPKLDRHNLYEAIRHELRHIIDLAKNQFFAVISEARDKLENSLEDVQKLVNVASPSYTTIGKAFYCQAENFLLEGLARYSEKLNWPKYDKKLFKQLYNRARSEQEQHLCVDKNYLRHVNSYRGNISKSAEHFSKHIAEELQDISYVIGLHMVYTIKMYVKISFRKFLTLSPRDFIILYEKAFARAKKDDIAFRFLPPVISYESGAGLFDYTKTMDLLHKIFSKKTPYRYRGKRKGLVADPEDFVGQRRTYYKMCLRCKKNKVRYDERFCEDCFKKYYSKKCKLCEALITKEAKFCPVCGESV